MSVDEVAAEHQQQQVELASRIAGETAALWRRFDPANLDGSWVLQADRMLALVVGGQTLAVRSADPYVTSVLDAQHLDPAAEGSVGARALIGIASDGRDLTGLLHYPIITVKHQVGLGAGVDEAMTSGLLDLDMIVRTQVADAGRVAVGVATTVRRRVDGYVRMLTPPSCGRCSVLAGKFYRWNAGFQRHPRCDCRHIPGNEDTVGDIRTDAGAYFRSLSRAEQDRQFTKSGARAIRDGADIGQVVNARRAAFGLTPAGAHITREEALVLRNGLDRGRLQTQRIFGRDVFTTTEGTTVRGLAGVRLGARANGVRAAGVRNRVARAPRLMPETIYQMAESRDEAIRLLKRFGYIL